MDGFDLFAKLILVFSFLFEVFLFRFATATGKHNELAATFPDTEEIPKSKRSFLVRVFDGKCFF